MSGIYSMTGGPSYTGASRQDLFDSAMNQPLSLTSTLLDQAKGGILESFGLGTAIKDLTTPQGNEAPSLAEPAFGMAAIPIPGAYTLLKNGVQALTDQGQPLTEDAYKGSASYRKDIPWDQGMTDTRAAALAASDDAKKVREYYATKRPFASFIGAMAGQALDPVNYIPVFGEAVQAAAVGRFGFIGGRALVAGADAALNTGIAGAVTSGARGSFGDDVSWQGLISQMATAAMIGGAFGTLHGVFGSRVDPRAMSEAESRLSTLRTTQEARIALNEGIDAVAHGEDIKLSPNATEPMARVAEQINPARSPDLFAPLDRQDLYSSTAVGRVIDSRAPHVQNFETAMRGQVLSTDPELAARYQAAEAKFTAAQEKLAAIEEPLAARKQSDAVAMIDQPSADRLRAIETELAQQPKAKRVAALEAERNTIIESLGPDQIAKAESDFRIGPQKQAKQARSALASARQEFSKVRREADARATQLDTVNKLRNKVAIDTTTARPEPPPEGIKQAEAAIAKLEDTKALAEQHKVDPQTGTFPEEADLHQLSAEGRFTEHDAATMAQAQADYETGAAFSEALKSVAGCLI
jgi:hypothetical protein